LSTAPNNSTPPAPKAPSATVKTPIYTAAIELDTGKYYEWQQDSQGSSKWVEVGGPPRFDTFTITAYDPNASALRVDSQPIAANFVRLPFHLADRKTPEGEQVYVFPDGYQWIYSASAPVPVDDNGVPVDDNGNVSGSKFDIDPTTGKWTYTPNATLAKSGGTEVVTITATATGTDHPTITCRVSDGKDECGGKITFVVDPGG
jgi:hypothetical protein